jgi:histone H3/H4
VTCWEVHLPGANHRESWAEERTAPAEAAPQPSVSNSEPNKTGTRRIVREAPAPSVESNATEEILIIASRLKEYIRARSGFSTSERVLAPLSAIVRQVCDAAIANATRDERKTVLDRDIPVK